MKMQSRRAGDSLYIYLDGELDEHNAAAVRGEADRLLEANTGASNAIFNLAAVRFMDSTGIGFLIGRYNKLKKFGMGMYLENPNPSADKVLALSGVYAIMPKI